MTRIRPNDEIIEKCVKSIVQLSRNRPASKVIIGIGIGLLIEYCIERELI